MKVAKAKGRLIEYDPPPKQSPHALQTRGPDTESGPLRHVPPSLQAAYARFRDIPPAQADATPNGVARGRLTGTAFPGQKRIVRR